MVVQFTPTPTDQSLVVQFNQTPTEPECGGTILYFADYITSKSRSDLEMLFYKPKVLESSFIEIINSSRKHIVCGYIYRHPQRGISMSLIFHFLVAYLKN